MEGMRGAGKEEKNRKTKKLLRNNNQLKSIPKKCLAVSCNYKKNFFLLVLRHKPIKNKLTDRV